MRLVIQKVKQAAVHVDGSLVGEIGHGLLLYVGFTHEDQDQDLDYGIRKLLNLRIFEDEQGKMNLSLLDVGGQILSVSQFTLYGDIKKGNRPSFTQAAKPEMARQLYDRFNQKLADQGMEVQTGEFGAMMEVSSINDGPVTIWLDSHQK